MSRRSPGSPRTYTRYPYTTILRSGQIEPDADRRPVDRGDDRHFQLIKRRRDKLNAGAIAIADRIGRPGEHAGAFVHMLDVAARTKGFALAGQHDGADAGIAGDARAQFGDRSEENTSELQSLMRISYAVFCLNKKKKK